MPRRHRKTSLMPDLLPRMSPRLRAVEFEQLRMAVKISTIESMTLRLMLTPLQRKVFRAMLMAQWWELGFGSVTPPVFQALQRTAALPFWDPEMAGIPYEQDEEPP